MEVINAPQYVVETLINEIDRLKVDRGFVKSIMFCDTVHNRESGYIHPNIKDKRIVDVDITICGAAEDMYECKKSIIHEAKHAKQFFVEGMNFYGNREYNELAASFYENRRALEETLKSAYRSLVSMLPA